ncbi:glycerate kinase [Myxococcota bacterium]|nr:glycerate kinase [Myxococcota bacterium]MBU1534684.1 glycerate kinase [Myxococcota bacterium]
MEHFYLSLPVSFPVVFCAAWDILGTMKVLIATDSFKGTLTPAQASETIGRAIAEVLPSASVTLAPVSDGGDGFLSVLSPWLGLSPFSLSSLDPSSRPITITVGINRERKVAVVESASAVGFQFLPDAPPLLQRTTVGLGMVLKTLHEQFPGFAIYLAAGGTITMDGGLGLVSALGLDPLDIAGRVLEATALNMNSVCAFAARHPFSADEFSGGTLLVDVDNYLLGQKGAAVVFGPQKGATAGQVQLLGEAYEGLMAAVSGYTGRAVIDEPGLGAAGGLGLMLTQVLGYRMRSGAEFLLLAMGFDDLLRSHDLVITGEGRFDEQSLQGKITGRVVKKAKEAGTPLVVFSGTADPSMELEHGDLVVLSHGEPGNMGVSRARAVLYNGARTFFKRVFC